MRIRTIGGPPLDAEIAVMAARAVALTQLHHDTGRSTSGNATAMDRPEATRMRPDSSTGQMLPEPNFGTVGCVAGK
ncbi:hypothetical protein HQO26_17210 [Rhodococcus fascians]|nr:hypothetical protein [Rhodococcus fascians]MBY4418839.1 hypothetical protein [Rhodococcus fascians]